MPDAANATSRVNARILRDESNGHARQGSEFPEAIKKPEITAACGTDSPFGTGLANLPLHVGCAQSPASKTIFPHGGARNSANRTSDYLTPKKAQKLIEAAHRAIQIGRPLNRHITIHWEAAGLSDREAMQATTAFLKYLREWLRGDTAYLWVRENGEGKGSHVHILAHVPRGKAMSGAISQRWIRRCTGKPYQRDLIHTRKVRGSDHPDSLLYTENFGTVFSYDLKGAEPSVTMALGREHKPGGTIIGKRCGTSRNIGGD
ncbi:hypothetical protein [Qipengyuania seohaensis]|uniref:hypothetical protein n=1 Tax=Qipengyuania seohaensis TaxID=266951 RepID=UPI0012FE2ECF|nr:hypothetical protein [Qipengyuania seohaensis]